MTLTRYVLFNKPFKHASSTNPDIKAIGVGSLRKTYRQLEPPLTRDRFI